MLRISCQQLSIAQMAELVYALVSGTSEGNLVGVQVPLWAQ
jgi:hypothetical protein